MRPVEFPRVDDNLPPETESQLAGLGRSRRETVSKQLRICRVQGLESVMRQEDV